MSGVFSLVEFAAHPDDGGARYARNRPGDRRARMRDGLRLKRSALSAKVTPNGQRYHQEPSRTKCSTRHYWRPARCAPRSRGIPKVTRGNVGSDNPKALWHELGTSKIPPRSFLVGAAIRMEPEIHAMAAKAAVAVMMGEGLHSAEMRELLHLLKHVAHEVKETVTEMTKGRYRRTEAPPMKIPLADAPGGPEFIDRCADAVRDLSLFFVGEPEEKMLAVLEQTRAT